MVIPVHDYILINLHRLFSQLMNLDRPARSHVSGGWRMVPALFFSAAALMPSRKLQGIKKDERQKMSIMCRRLARLLGDRLAENGRRQKMS